jgi:predicted dehydrogenase
MARKYEIAGVFTDYHEMIEKAELHALIIAAPDDLHYAMAMDALNAGLHILCEKPMARNVEQAREMYEKAESVGVRHMVMFTHRWWPHIAYLKKLIDEGHIGRCYHCDMVLLWEYAREARYEWRLDRERSNGVLGDLGSHMIDWARLFVGEVARVSAHLNHYVQRPGPDGRILDPANDSAVLALEFENGAQGAVHVSFIPHIGNRIFEMNVTLHGLEGTLEAVFSALTAEVHAAGANSKDFDVKTFPEYLTPAAEQGDISPMFEIFQRLPIGDRLFIDSILEEGAEIPTFCDGLRAQEVVDAAIQSHENGSWVSLK